MASALAPALPAHAAAGCGRSRLVRGTVVDGRTGSPLPGARVTVTPPESEADVSTPPPVGCDGDGRFSIPAATGAWLLVEHPDYLPELLPATTSPERLALTAPGSIWGRVRDGRGVPLAGIRVRASCPEALDLADAESDATGSFCLTGLRPGRWAVLALSSGPPARATVRLRSGETACAELRLARARTS